MTEDEMVGQHHRLNEHESEQALRVGHGQGSLGFCSPWGHKELDTTGKLNWTEWIEYVPLRNWLSTAFIFLEVVHVYCRELENADKQNEYSFPHHSEIITNLLNVITNHLGYFLCKYMYKYTRKHMHFSKMWSYSVCSYQSSWFLFWRMIFYLSKPRLYLNLRNWA